MLFSANGHYINALHTSTSTTPNYYIIITSYLCELEQKVLQFFIRHLLEDFGGELTDLLVWEFTIQQLQSNLHNYITLCHNSSSLIILLTGYVQLVLLNIIIIFITVKSPA